MITYGSAYYVEATLFRPNRNVDTNLANYRARFEMGAELFNTQFATSRKIEILNIDQQYVRLLVIFDSNHIPSGKVSLVNIGEYSKILYDAKRGNLKDLSNVPNKLLTAPKFEKLTDNEFLRILNEYGKTLESLGVLAGRLLTSNVSRVPEENSEVTIEEDMNFDAITDEELESTVSFLLATKLRDNERADAIRKLKKIVAKFILPRN